MKNHVKKNLLRQTVSHSWATVQFFLPPLFSCVNKIFVTTNKVIKMYFWLFFLVSDYHFFSELSTKLSYQSPGAIQPGLGIISGYNTHIWRSGILGENNFSSLEDPWNFFFSKFAVRMSPDLYMKKRTILCFFLHLSV